MMISNRQVDQVLQAYMQRENLGGKAKSKAMSQPADTLTLSERGQAIQKAKQAVFASGEVRSDKVTNLRQAIAQGSYHPSGTLVAEKMLGRSLVDRLA